MVKRLIDVVLSAGLLAITAPVLLGAALLVWLHDGGAPIYRAPRVGRGGRDIVMLKLRTMVVDGDRLGGPSTAGSDARITPIGAALRRRKLDELPQLLNVLAGDMSLVGPRPNVRRGGVDLYTPAELELLSVRPGVADLSSIVFSDEADILDGAPDPDARYEAVIRPWKSRLGLLYVERRSLALDLRILWLTAMAVVHKPTALAGVARILADLGAGEELRRVCRRDAPPSVGEPPREAA